MMFQRLSMENYIQWMCTLLHLEEIQMELDIQGFSMHRVSSFHFFFMKSRIYTEVYIGIKLQPRGVMGWLSW